MYTAIHDDRRGHDMTFADFVMFTIEHGEVSITWGGVFLLGLLAVLAS